MSLSLSFTTQSNNESQPFCRRVSATHYMLPPFLSSSLILQLVSLSFPSALHPSSLCTIIIGGHERKRVITTYTLEETLALIAFSHSLKSCLKYYTPKVYTYTYASDGYNASLHQMRRYVDETHQKLQKKKT